VGRLARAGRARAPRARRPQVRHGRLQTLAASLRDVVVARGEPVHPFKHKPAAPVSAQARQKVLVDFLTLACARRVFQLTHSSFSNAATRLHLPCAAAQNDNAPAAGNELLIPQAPSSCRSWHVEQIAARCLRRCARARLPFSQVSLL